MVGREADEEGGGGMEVDTEEDAGEAAAGKIEGGDITDDPISFVCMDTRYSIFNIFLEIR